MTRDFAQAKTGGVIKPRVLVFAPHTRSAPTRSGIHRVVIGLIEHLPRHARVDLVKWDEMEGQLRYCDKDDLLRYLGGPPPAGIDIHPFAHRINYRFGDTIPAHEPVTVLMPEPFYLIENGNEIHARVIAQCLVQGWTTAALFYDLIPLKRPGYAERDRSARSLAELLRVDVVLPISHFVCDDLRSYLETKMGLAPMLLQRSGQRVVGVPLPDRGKAETTTKCSDHKRDIILLVGTIEPRKQQVRVVRAFVKLQLAKRAGLKLVLIGSMNPQSEEECRALVESNPSVSWLGYATDEQLDATFSSTRFSVFASRDEGFGLPIVESLARGVPCLTADHGAMREAASGGGCLLVDVEDDVAIEAGLERLAFDDRTLTRLHAEIDRRAWRSWDDYAAEIVAAIDSYEPEAKRARPIAEAAVTRLFGASPTSGCGRVARPKPITIVELKDGLEPRPGRRVPYTALVAPDADPDDLPPPVFDKIVGADAWFCCDASAYTKVVARAAASGTDGLLSGRCGWCAEPDRLGTMMTSELTTLIERRRRRAVAALRDNLFRQAWARLDLPSSRPTLTIVISVYNGAAFVVRNIEHTLQLIRPFEGQVRLLVVDNASTDETPQLVGSFAASGEIDFIRVASNTGLLGNLHTISTLMLARHVWVIGVDDVIVPGAVERILAVLAEDPACPFVLPNFAVYHRDVFAPAETCANLLAECKPVGVDCGADETTVVRSAASRHDNLLTAFYIVIFRSDLMAAVFNNPFTAPFFGSLIDTIPTTKVMFELFSEFAAAWLEAPVVAGNGRNTWQHHRVAWHGVLMPQAFELARDAGLDRNRLRQWARHHIDLLAEANGLFPNPNILTTFSEEALEPSFRVFGARLLPDFAGASA